MPESKEHDANKVGDKPVTDSPPTAAQNSMKNSIRYKADRRLFLYGFIAFFGILYLSTYSHALGHAVVCEASGFSSIVSVNSIMFEPRSVSCSDAPENVYLWRSIGGIAGVLVSLVPLAIFRMRKFIIIGSVPNVLFHALTGIMATVAFDWYVRDSTGSVIAGLLSILLFIALLLRFGIQKIEVTTDGEQGVGRLPPFGMESFEQSKANASLDAVIWIVAIVFFLLAFSPYLLRPTITEQYTFEQDIAGTSRDITVTYATQDVFSARSNIGVGVFVGIIGVEDVGNLYVYFPEAEKHGQYIMGQIDSPDLLLNKQDTNYGAETKIRYTSDGQKYVIISQTPLTSIPANYKETSIPVIYLAPEEVKYQAESNRITLSLSLVAIGVGIVAAHDFIKSTFVRKPRV